MRIRSVVLGVVATFFMAGASDAQSWPDHFPLAQEQAWSFGTSVSENDGAARSPSRAWTAEAAQWIPAGLLPDHFPLVFAEAPSVEPSLNLALQPLPDVPADLTAMVAAVDPSSIMVEVPDVPADAGAVILAAAGPADPFSPETFLDAQPEELARPIAAALKADDDLATGSIMPTRSVPYMSHEAEDALAHSAEREIDLSQALHLLATL